MKKIFIPLLVVLAIACHNEGVRVGGRGSETGRFPYQVLMQTYQGDTLLFTIGDDSIHVYTNQDYFNFNKVLLINGDTVEGTGASIPDVLEVDTIKWATNMVYYGNASGHYWVAPSTNYYMIYEKAPGISYGQLTVPGVLEVQETAPLATLSGISEQTGMIVQPNDTNLMWWNGSDWIDITVGTGGGGTIGGSVAANQIPYASSSNTLTGNDSLKYIYGTLRMAPSTSGDTIIYLRTAGGYGIVLNNFGTSNGIRIGNYHASGEGMYIFNSGAGTGQYVYNNSTGDGIYIHNAVSGGTGINAFTQSTGTAFIARTSADTSLIVRGDSTIFPKFASAGISWPIFTSTGAVDSGHVSLTWRGLEMALKDPETYLNDKKLVLDPQTGEMHYEMKLFYIEDGTGELKSQYGNQGLSPLETASAHYIHAEILTRWAADHERRLQELERKIETPAKINSLILGICFASLVIVAICFYFLGKGKTQ